MECPICQAAPREFDPGMHLYRCEECQHTFTILPKDKQEKYESNYFDDSHRRWFENPDTGLFRRVERQLAARRGPGPARLLDVGCGRGDFLKWILERHPDWDLTGIDLAPNTHDRIRFIQGDIYDTRLEGPFDIITTFMVVEHLESLRPFFDQMRHLLKPGGLFVVNTFNNDSLMFRIARVLKKFGIRSAYERLYSHHHLQHYSRASIQRVIRQAGFEILAHRCHNYPLKAVDVPRAGALIEGLYRMAVGAIFLVSNPLGLGIEHTVICRRSA
jgi:2-polyprenyl-3-methyl-5-hydroxy-6-metoxy-1,4-benzoquinol methylase